MIYLIKDNSYSRTMYRIRKGNKCSYAKTSISQLIKDFRKEGYIDYSVLPNDKEIRFPLGDIDEFNIEKTILNLYPELLL